MTTLLDPRESSVLPACKTEGHHFPWLKMTFLLFTLNIGSILCAQSIQPAQSGAAVLPTALATDNSGNIYFTDPAGNVVYKMAPSGATSIVPCCAQTSASLSSLSSPRSVAVDAVGDILVADTGNNRIVTIDPEGNASILHTGTLTLSNPSGISIDNNGDIYIADAGDNRVIRVNPSGGASIISTGNYVLSNPSSVSVDHSSSLYISDTGNNRILQITPDLQAVFATGIEAPTTATMDASGNAYIAQAPGSLQGTEPLQAASVLYGKQAVLASIDTSSVTITPTGQSIVQPTTISITLTPVNGFNKTLSLGVLGLPPSSAGSFTPQTVTFNGASPVVAKFSFGIINPGQGIYLTQGAQRQRLLHRAVHLSVLASIVPLSCLLLFGIGTKRQEWKRWCRSLSVMVLIISLATIGSMISGCAGGIPAALNSTYSATLIATTPGSMTLYQLGSFQIALR